MHHEQPKNPLHGVKLEEIVTRLVEHYGWQTLSEHVNINCFKKDPSVKSSLKFLRRTPWAREQVEQLYIKTFSTWPYNAGLN
ncbi:VF530 family protein [Pseudoalteromonas pernae]|uniref:VF530 family protein n=1 Tax=Pseudoalteromonas pernae TaxID=3118054 RepID=UPI003242502B